MPLIALDHAPDGQKHDLELPLGATMGAPC